jgi:hypothetical protein
MAPTTITHTALSPDGRQITMSCRANRLQADWFWHMRLTSRTVALGVSVAAPDYFDHTVASRGMQPRQEITYAGRPFVLGIDERETSWMAAWKGAYHCLTFGGATPAPMLAPLVALLEQLEITDRPEGMTVRPVPGSGVVTWGLSGVKVADAGMVTIYARADAASLLPDQPGLRVENGRVWSKSLDTGSQSRSRKYVHVGESAVCTIDDDLGRDPAVTADGQAELLASLSVRWDR